MKASQVHEFSNEELRIEEERLRKQHYDLRSQAVTEKLENPKLLSQIRRDIARLCTERRRRQIEEA